MRNSSTWEGRGGGEGGRGGGGGREEGGVRGRGGERENRVHIIVIMCLAG